MPSIPDTECTSSTGSSSSLTTVSSSSTESFEALSRVTEDIQSKGRKAFTFDGQWNTQTDMDDQNRQTNCSTSKANGVVSSSESELSFESSSEMIHFDPVNSPSLMKPQVTRLPAVNHHKTVVAEGSQNKNSLGVRRVQSVKYSQDPVVRSGDRSVVIPQRSNSTHRPNDQSISTRMEHHQPRAATLTSLQVSSFDQQDPVQKFHQRYYDKLLQYIELVQKYFPFPVAVSYQNASKSDRYRHSNQSDFVWFVNQYDYLSVDRTTLGSMDSHDQSERREMHLHFACSIRHPQCMYPGDTLKSCFCVKTKQALIWLQLLVLWNQSRYGKAISTNHPAMLPLRHLWAIIMNVPFESPLERKMRLRSLDRPRSACESSNERASLMNTVQPRIQPSSKLHLWNLSRNNSKTGLAKLNSFFLIATRAYPNLKECERLVKELQAAQLFESFVRQEPIHMDHLSSNRNRSNENRPEDLRSFPVRKWHGWCCAMCTHTLSLLRNGESTHDAPLARRESESESLDDIRRRISIPRNPSTWMPYMTGVLRSRHLKSVPKALSWLSPWQLNEFILHGTLFGWHRWLPSTMEKTEKQLMGVKNDLQCRLTHETETSCHVFQRDATRESNLKDDESYDTWTIFDVSSIRTIQGRRKNRTGALIQLVIDTEKHGTLLLRRRDSRSSQSSPGRANFVDQPAIRAPITYTHYNQLTVWLHCLQSAVNRARQESHRC